MTYIQGIINATCPFFDALLTLDNPLYNPLRALIALLNYYSPCKMCLLDPAISDGRVIFFLPTPSQAQPIRLPRFPGNRVPQRKISAGYLKKSVTIPSLRILKFRWVIYLIWCAIRGRQVQKAWSETIRQIFSDNVLLTIAGGRWMTYRAMAEVTIDTAIISFGLRKVKNGCITDALRLVGSDWWSRNMFIGLIQTVNSSFGVLNYCICTDAAVHSTSI